MNDVPFISILLTNGAVILTPMILLWFLSLLLKNTSIVDIFWGVGFVIIAWFTFFLSPGYLPRKILICTLTTIWGLRLAIHIGIRNWGEPEDFRYAKWRQEKGARWRWSSFFQVFLLQGILMWAISAPLVAAQTSEFPAILTSLDYFGVGLWTFGLLFESISDFQLTIFKADSSNKGNLLTTGLWKYSRHPNYFGEAVLWWGFYIVALVAGQWWTIFSPILMTWLLLSVSGVAMLEHTLRLKPGYEEYIRKTSVFFPWFPKS